VPDTILLLNIANRVNFVNHTLDFEELQETGAVASSAGTGTEVDAALRDAVENRGRTCDDGNVVVVEDNGDGPGSVLQGVSAAAAAAGDWPLRVASVVEAVCANSGDGAGAGVTHETAVAEEPNAADNIPVVVVSGTNSDKIAAVAATA